jgi:hypothetical protein
MNGELVFNVRTLKKWKRNHNPELPARQQETRKAFYSTAVVVMRGLGAIRFFSVFFQLPLKAESTCC